MVVQGPSDWQEAAGSATIAVPRSRGLPPRQLYRPNRFRAMLQGKATRGQGGGLWECGGSTRFGFLDLWMEGAVAAGRDVPIRKSIDPKRCPVSPDIKFCR